MSLTLVDHQYELAYFPDHTQIDVNKFLTADAIKIINKLSSLVGAPTYQKTPVFIQHRSRNRMPHRQKVISEADWTEIRNFKSTELIKREEGVDKDIDELRGLLNKLTSSNYDSMEKNIVKSLTTIIEKDCKEEDLEKIGEAIFEIGSINKFWSALFAKLYKTILTTFPSMNGVYEKNFTNFMSLFNDIRYVSAEEDYNEFCRVNKENEKRRSMGSFFVHLMNNDVISEVAIFDLIGQLKNKMMCLMDTEGKKKEVAEFAENIVILVNGGKNKLSISTVGVDFGWKECLNFIEDMTKRKVVNHLSLSNKVVFKFMDLEEEL